MKSKSLDCNALQRILPDLIADLDRDSALAAAPEVRTHLAACADCAKEYAALESTMHLLDLWAAPEPSPYFDQKLAVLLREEQARPKLGWLGRWRERLVLNTGHQFRPAVAAALALMLLAGGGGALRIASMSHGAAIQTSAAVNDLQILDKNDQTIQQMDQLLQDDGSSQTASPAQPAS